MFSGDGQVKTVEKAATVAKTLTVEPKNRKKSRGIFKKMTGASGFRFYFRGVFGIIGRRRGRIYRGVDVERSDVNGIGRNER